MPNRTRLRGGLVTATAALVAVAGLALAVPTAAAGGQAASTKSAPRPDGVPGRWKYVGGTVFNGTHVPAPWKVYGVGRRNGCLPYSSVHGTWCASQVKEGGGHVEITGLTHRKDGGLTWSGKALRYGLWQARMRFWQTGRGHVYNVNGLLWPSTGADWPNHTELDFAETPSSAPWLESNLHWGNGFNRRMFTDHYHTAHTGLSHWFTVDIETSRTGISEWFNGRHWFTARTSALLRELTLPMHPAFQLGALTWGTQQTRYYVTAHLEVRYLRIWRPAG